MDEDSIICISDNSIKLSDNDQSNDEIYILDNEPTSSTNSKKSSNLNRNSFSPINKLSTNQLSTYKFNKNKSTTIKKSIVNSNGNLTELSTNNNLNNFKNTSDLISFNDSTNLYRSINNQKLKQKSSQFDSGIIVDQFDLPLDLSKKKVSNESSKLNYEYPLDLSKKNSLADKFIESNQESPLNLCIECDDFTNLLPGKFIKIIF